MSNTTLLQKNLLSNLFGRNQTLFIILKALSQNLESNLWPRLIGGCVRDALLGIAPYDIDIATPLTPKQVISRLPGAKLIPIGINFGTIKAILNSQEFEITTLRKDFGCNGRHTMVEFTNDFQVDAERRDFTINAISYCPFRDELFDYFDGIKHILEKKVVFIGDPEKRIQEDYLRIMRFFRFSAKYANEIDSLGYENCVKYSNKLSQISCERIKMELDRILSQSNKAILFKMMSGNVLQTILPELKLDLKMLEKTSNICLSLNQTPSIQMHYASLLNQNDCSSLLKILKKQKFSKAAIDAILNLLDGVENISNSSQLQKKLLQRHYKNFNTKEYAILVGCLKSIPMQEVQNCLNEAMSTQKKPIPISGLDMIKLGYKGKEIGSKMAFLENIWIESRFTLPKAELIERAKNAEAS